MRILTILQAALAVCGLAGCGRGAEPVVLGAVYDLTGGQAELDLPSSRGARLAVDEANRAGGVLGRPVALELVDGRSDPETLRRVTGELLEDEPGPVALFGLSDTDMVLAAAPVAAEHGRLFVTSGATSPRLPGEVPEYLFLACFGDNAQAAAGAEHAYRSLGARRAVVLFDGTMTYTRLLHRYFEERFDGIFFTTHAALGPDAADPRVQAFREAYAAAYGGEEPDAFAALGYDTARLLLRAVGDAGSTDPEAVRRALAAVTDFVGITGTLAYTDGRRVPEKEVAVLEVTAGGTRLAAGIVPSDVPEP